MFPWMFPWYTQSANRSGFSFNSCLPTHKSALSQRGVLLSSSAASYTPAASCTAGTPFLNQRASMECAGS